MTIETRQVGPLSMRAALGSVDVKRRTVDVVWSTGAKVKRSSWFDGPFFEELVMDPSAVRMDRLNSGNAPFLSDHNGYSVADQPGVIESARLEGGKGIATVRFVREGVDPEADKLFSKIQDGIVRNVSVGYRVHKVEKTERVLATDIPTFRVTDWEPMEVSAVSMPADAGAGFRSERPAELNPCQIITHNPQHNRGTMEPENTPQNPDPTPTERAENERQVLIRSFGAAAKNPDLAARLIVEGVTVDEARTRILDDMAARSDALTEKRGSGLAWGEDAADKQARGAESYLLQRFAPEIAREAKAKGVPAFAHIDLSRSTGFEGRTLLEIARQSLERRGIRTAGLSRLDLAGKAFTTRGAYSGTSDFSVLLENTMGKVLIGGYAITPDTWSAICAKKTVPDFRDSTFYRTGTLGVLDSKTENGEFKNKSIPDGSKQSIKVATKGNIIGISRELVINDDMGALATLAASLGRAAKLSQEADFYALLAQNAGLGPTMADGHPFFDAANHANVSTGAALSVDGLDADRVTMGSQMDDQGNEYLDVRPSVLLVPLSLGGTARVINSSQQDPSVVGKIAIPNKVAGLFSLVVDTPRLTGTRRYVFADKNLMPAAIMATLEGQGDGPTVESEAGWRVDGTEMRVRMDYRVQMVEPKAAVTNAGA